MKTRRHAKILEIIQNEAVDTQEELLSRLCKEGFHVTQATVSRDIKELRLVKTLRKDGTYRYTPFTGGEGAGAEKFYSLFSDAVQSVDFAGHIVVVKCFAGMANAVCAGVDGMHFKGIIGTLAGDDTFLCIAKDENNAVEMVAELKKFMKK